MITEIRVYNAASAVKITSTGNAADDDAVRVTDGPYTDPAIEGYNFKVTHGGFDPIVDLGSTGDLTVDPEVLDIEVEVDRADFDGGAGGTYKMDGTFEARIKGDYLYLSADTAVYTQEAP